MATSAQITAAKATVDTDIVDKTDEDSITKVNVGGNIKTAMDLTLSPYKAYVAQITQSGTSDPTVVVLQNDLGGTPTVTRTGAGGYSITLSGAFATAAKCVGFPTQQVLASSVAATINDFSLFRQTANNFRLVTRTNAVAADNLLSDFPLEIRVYN